MDSLKRFFLVSFGHSARYRFSSIEKTGETGLHHKNPFAKIEQRLRDFLKSRFPKSDSFAYFTSAKSEEIPWNRRDNYKEYPRLDEKAMEEIEKELEIEVADMDSIRTLNNNAPFSAVAD